MKKRRKNIIKAVSVVGIVIVIILGIAGIIYNNLKTEVYRFPENFVDYAGLTVEQQIEAINRDNLKEDICTDVYVTEEGAMEIKLNKKQREKWIKKIKEKIEKSERVIEEKGGVLKVSNEQKRVIMEVPSGVSPELILEESFRATVCVAEYQILTEENSEDWEIYLCFKNIETGEIIADGTIPYDTIEFTDKDLK